MNIKKIIPSFLSFLLTASTLLIIRLKVARPMLLADRFLYGAGTAEAFILGLYAGFITWKMLDPDQSSKWRMRIWTLFSILFFTQLILGIFISDIFLMSGKLHVPVPAVIIGGPVYRGEGFFMPILLFSTIVLTGPAWCSHLCYFGSWDGIAASAKKRAGSTIPYKYITRTVIIIIVVSAALLLRFMDVKPEAAAVTALVFGLAGVVIMILFSLKKGLMVHCLAWCPIGLIVAAAGRISPFRISFDDKCSSCGLCSSACRYDSLRPGDISRKKPDLSCTLCGDCISACPGNSLQYSFFQFRSNRVRAVFIVIIAAMHSIFLGLARI